MIRNYCSTSDFENLFRLNMELNPDEDKIIFKNDIENVKAKVLVATHNGEPVGFISFSFPYWDRIAMTHHLVIDKTHRNKGMGAELIKEAADYCKDAGMKKLTLRTALWNWNATKLYKKSGFIPISVFPDYLGDGNDMVWMDLNLA